MKRVIEDMGYSVAFPKYMGCKRGGGDWNIIYSILKEEFKDYNVILWKLKKENNI